jgi:hypothetical protein
MKIDELQKYAKENGFDSVKFKFTNTKGKTVEGHWLDAFFGLFRLNDNDGFIRVETWKEYTNDIFEFEVIK